MRAVGQARDSRGLVQVWNVPLSRLHSKRARSVAVLENVTVAVVPVTVTPPIVTTGVEVSTSYARVTLSTSGVKLVFVVVSVARYCR